MKNVCEIIKELGQVGPRWRAFRVVLTYDTLTEMSPVSIVDSDGNRYSGYVRALCLIRYVAKPDAIHEEVIRVQGLRFGDEGVIVIESPVFKEDTDIQVKSIELPDIYASDLLKSELEVVDATKP